jgi:hypothetical protein
MEQTQVSAARRRWLRRLAGGLAVAVGALVAPALTAQPAAAVSQTFLHPEIVDGCPRCPGPLVYWVREDLNARVVVVVEKSFAQGVSGLIAASAAKDPAVAKRLHDAAIRTLADGAGQAGNTAWSAGDWDGDLCPRWKWPFPGPKPHWDETQRWLAEGMTLLGEFNRTGDAGLLDRAAEDLGAGADGLTDFQGCV